ncbi:MAG: ferredoxin [Candidatus Brocadia sp.]|nr:ferredoxin [Candidatus Brocadia sp.]
MPTVWFEGNCVKCAMCTEEASRVFVFVENVGPEVRTEVDIASHGEDIKRAAQFCPTECIKYSL